MAIWISQWLCPQRHCSVALAWDENQITAEEVKDEGEAIYDTGVINRYCGICNGGLHVEHGKTIFKNMDEAAQLLSLLQAANLRSRDILQNKN